jgi:hypothetical protein
MTIDDISAAGARLASLIGEPPIKLETEAELLEYVGYVNSMANGLLGGSPVEEIRNGMSAGGMVAKLGAVRAQGARAETRKTIGRTGRTVRTTN